MPGNRRPPGDRTIDTARGQTTLDFVLAIGVFVVAVAFVFGFVPGMLDPFTQDQAEGQVADRVADAVVDDLADDVASPAELNETRTTAYFDGGSDLAERVGVAPTYGINVTVGRPTDGESGSTVLCGAGGAIQPCAAGGDALQMGEPMPASSTTEATARRAVIVDDQVAIVTVRVWS